MAKVGCKIILELLISMIIKTIKINLTIKKNPIQYLRHNLIICKLLSINVSRVKMKIILSFLEFLFEIRAHPLGTPDR